VGGARACLDRAIGHVKERVQFGRPVGRFQAVKHRAADAYGALELARSAAYWAWWVVAEDRPELAEAAHVAASLAAEAYDRAARECIHLHGGMGFTWEHDAHLYLRRARTSQTLLGDPIAHRAALAAELGIAVR
jgi:alkylation response protein AidB-like acyl-CoA dehydrogenase